MNMLSSLRSPHIRYLFTVGIFCFGQSYALSHADDTITQSIEVDIDAPLIEHSPVRYTDSSNQEFIFSATVTDNVGVQMVSVFYREEGDMSFVQLLMAPTGDNHYKAILPLSRIRTSSFEYYLKAIDLSGNTKLKGVRLSPIKVILDADKRIKEILLAEDRRVQQSIAQASPPPQKPTIEITNNKKRDEPADSPWYKNPWVWVGVVAGGLAAYGASQDQQNAGPIASTGTIGE